MRLACLVSIGCTEVIVSDALERHEVLAYKTEKTYRSRSHHAQYDDARL